MNTVMQPLYKSDQRRGRPERRKTPLKRVYVDREWLAWAAGVVDGEGCFCRSSSIDQWHPEGRPVFSVGQVDRRLLDRFRGVIQMGKVYGPYGPYGDSLVAKPHYRLDLYGFEQVQTLMALLWTWLGPVKREQAKSVLYQGVCI